MSIIKNIISVFSTQIIEKFVRQINSIILAEDNNINSLENLNHLLVILNFSGTNNLVSSDNIENVFLFIKLSDHNIGSCLKL